MGLHIAHDAYDGFCHFVPFFLIGNGYGVVHHFLEMAAIFRNNELWALSIVF